MSPLFQMYPRWVAHDPRPVLPYSGALPILGAKWVKLQLPSLLHGLYPPLQPEISLEQRKLEDEGGDSYNFLSSEGCWVEAGPSTFPKRVLASTAYWYGRPRDSQLNKKVLILRGCRCRAGYSTVIQTCCRDIR